MKLQRQKLLEIRNRFAAPDAPRGVSGAAVLLNVSHGTPYNWFAGEGLSIDGLAEALSNIPALRNAGATRAWAEWACREGNDPPPPLAPAEAIDLEPPAVQATDSQQVAEPIYLAVVDSATGRIIKRLPSGSIARLLAAGGSLWITRTKLRAG